MAGADDLAGVCDEDRENAERIWHNWTAESNENKKKWQFEKDRRSFYYGRVRKGSAIIAKSSSYLCSERCAGICVSGLNARRDRHLSDLAGSQKPAQVLHPKQVSGGPAAQPQVLLPKPMPAPQKHAAPVAAAQASSSNPQGPQSARFACDLEQPQKGIPTFSISHEPLVGLMAAIQPLIPHVPLIATHAEEALEYYDDGAMPFGLPLDQAAAIRLYTVQGIEGQSLYDKLNAALRTPNRPLMKPFVPYMRLLYEALRHPRLPKWNGATIVLRGMPGDLRDKHPVGKEFTWWGYSSTSTSLTSVCDFLGVQESTIFEICNAVCGVQIDAFSLYAEGEVLLPAGTVLRTTGITRLPGTNKHIIKVEVVGDKCKVV